MPLHRRRAPAVLAMATVLTLFGPAPARAASGDLDPTFGGGNGFVTYDAGGSDAGQKILRTPGGKILVAGQVASAHNDEDLFLARYTKGGKPDPTFGGGDGVVTMDFLGGYDDMWGLNRMGDGRIVVAGYAENPAGSFDHVAVARFLPNGAPDSSFSGDGKTTTAIPGYPNTYGWRSLVLPNGKIVVVGEAGAGASDADLFAVRYRKNGRLDRAFSGDGRFTVDLGGDDGAWDVRLLGDGTILAAGWSNRPAEGRIALVWITPRGKLDHDYGGGDGKAIVNLVPGNHVEFARAVFVLGTGKILVVGNAENAAGPGTSDDVIAARLKANGAKDPTFGGGDAVVGTDGGKSEVVFGARRTSAGALVAAGFSDFSFFVVRLHANGKADSSFGSNGFSAPFPGVGRANDVEVLPGGKVLATGSVKSDVTTVRLKA